MNRVFGCEKNAVIKESVRKRPSCNTCLRITITISNNRDDLLQKFGSKSIQAENIRFENIYFSIDFSIFILYLLKDSV